MTTPPARAALLTYPAPERNKDPILEVLRRVLPPHGRVLEVASGTGQHVVHFAQHLPQLEWQPSDPETQHRDAITARVRLCALDNVRLPLRLDVLERPWPVGDVSAIACINMIHIAPWQAARALLQEAGRLLPVQGVLYLYGPYLRSGHETAPGNLAFDADLRRRNPEWGVRNLEAVVDEAGKAGLALEELVEMPANNLSLVFRRGNG
jgi:SAM-dependent methyltransferase